LRRTWRSSGEAQYLERRQNDQETDSQAAAGHAQQQFGEFRFLKGGSAHGVVCHGRALGFSTRRQCIEADLVPAVSRHAQIFLQQQCDERIGPEKVWCDFRKKSTGPKDLWPDLTRPSNVRPK
jgi:hypothetical protein